MPGNRPEEVRIRRRGLLAGLGLGGSAVVLANCGDDGDDQGARPGGDLEIVNYVLALEHLEADLFEKVTGSGFLKGRERELAKRFGEEEREHVAALEKTARDLGGEPAKKPRTKFPLERREQVLELALMVQNLAAAAYLGQVDKVQDVRVLAAALSIHTVEARHAAAFAQAVGKSFTPDGAFARPASREESLEKVRPFIVS